MGRLTDTRIVTSTGIHAYVVPKGVSELEMHLWGGGGAKGIDGPSSTYQSGSREVGTEVVSEAKTVVTAGSTTIAASGAFTVPDGVTSVAVTAVGGGGGGGGYHAGCSNNCTHPGGSGGSGAVVTGVVSVTPGQSIAVTVGKGGSGGVASQNGTAGTSTSFAGISAGGGSGGIQGTSKGGGANGASAGNAGNGGLGGQTLKSDPQGNNGASGYVTVSWESTSYTAAVTRPTYAPVYTTIPGGSGGAGAGGGYIKKTIKVTEGDVVTLAVGGAGTGYAGGFSLEIPYNFKGGNAGYEIAGALVTDRIVTGTRYIRDDVLVPAVAAIPAVEPTTVTLDTAGSGTWTVPSGITSLLVTTIGGGGSGARASAKDPWTSGGGGGGAGGATTVTMAVTPGQTISYTVGAGGAAVTASSAGGNIGNNGGDTTFGNLSVTGGQGGQISQLNGGNLHTWIGGIGGSGDVNGQNGENGFWRLTGGLPPQESSTSRWDIPGTGGAGGGVSGWSTGGSGGVTIDADGNVQYWNETAPGIRKLLTYHTANVAIANGQVGTGPGAGSGGGGSGGPTGTQGGSYAGNDGAIIITYGGSAGVSGRPAVTKAVYEPVYSTVTRSAIGAVGGGGGGATVVLLNGTVVGVAAGGGGGGSANGTTSGGSGENTVNTLVGLNSKFSGANSSRGPGTGGGGGGGYYGGLNGASGDYAYGGKGGGNLGDIRLTGSLETAGGINTEFYPGNQAGYAGKDGAAVLHFIKSFNLSVKKQGIWKNLEAGFVKVNGVWKEIYNGWVKVLGVWEPLMSRAVALEVPVTYNISANVSNVDEGNAVAFTISTTGIANTTQIPYIATGIAASDLAVGSLTGNYVVGSTETISFVPRKNRTTNGARTLTVLLENTTTSANCVINDTSLDPTYTITPNVTYINEGQAVRFTLSTTEVDPGDEFPWSVTGINAADLAVGSVNGSFIVGTRDYVDFALREDLFTEGNETLTLSLNTKPARGSCVVVDTSKTPEGRVEYGYGTYSWTVPDHVYEIQVITVGAGGTSGSAYGGGGGALVYGFVAVNPGDKFNIFVGGINGQSTFGMTGGSGGGIGGGGTAVTKSTTITRGSGVIMPISVVLLAAGGGGGGGNAGDEGGAGSVGNPGGVQPWGATDSMAGSTSGGGYRGGGGGGGYPYGGVAGPSKGDDGGNGHGGSGGQCYVAPTVKNSAIVPGVDGASGLVNKPFFGGAAYGYASTDGRVRINWGPGYTQYI